MLIESRPDLKDTLAGKTVLITGAGGGIGFEAAKVFAYLGAKIIIAEINSQKGADAEKEINKLFPSKPAEFYSVDLADAASVNTLCDYVLEKHGCPDILFNNAAFVCMGAVHNVEASDWERSYQVNFRAPLLLAHRFLHTMINRNSGVVVFVSSSGASPYMGAYEVFKTTQVELSNTLAMELEGTGVYSYTIGPGLVKTETAMKAIETVAASMNMGLDDFYNMNGRHILDAESAGTGFALSVANALTYHGQEIGSIQVLMDFNLAGEKNPQDNPTQASPIPEAVKSDVLGRIIKTYEEQYEGWRAMNVFERQWVLRDFKKNMGLSADQALEKLKALEASLKNKEPSSISLEKGFLSKLKSYWEHQLKLLQSYQKDKAKREEHSQTLLGWISDIDTLISQ